MIEPGSLRYTAFNGERKIYAPTDQHYGFYAPIAQERFDKVCKQWIKIPDRYPTVLEVQGDYRVYLDGVIVPWWSKADRTRGFVDVLVAIGDYPPYGEFKMTNVHHRLFGVVTFEPVVLHQANVTL